ncbi:nucleotidyltransferase domain-containing protein [Peribacillus saganii]|uniref:Nucleotidyltransferase domain-containing protein n=1 Tax=Peribacillus saganii TaxID=2303992 RepID=A0A372LDV0_9BACI|nr:nucleotidyltransferase domain-containing protein [Peribacillus saganii]RFU64387.1 nucleotidyltransferase domain-containing protein [Peribacillus saganii]
MKEHIVKTLKQIETEHEVKILYACEAGSRAWGFPSKGSDYDVRFIYIHKTNWYLSIDQKRDVIEIPAQDSISATVHNLLDITGWDLTKALRLFRKSNPALLEWLRSNIVYYEAYSTIPRMKALTKDIFSPVSCLHHYLNMAKKNLRAYLQSSEEKTKIYFYMLRPVMAARWIEKHNSIPPIELQSLLEDVLPEGDLKEEITTIIKRKIAGKNLKTKPRNEGILHFLTEEINFLETYTRNLKTEIPDPTKLLDQLFRDSLKEIWNESTRDD